MNTFNKTGRNLLDPAARGGKEEAHPGRILKYPGTKRNIWAIGGGKGGVGKSLVASNLAVMLARKGFRVLMVDADLGSPNLHTFLGMEGPRASLSNFLSGRETGIDRVISRTPVPNLEIISGAKAPLDAADVKKDGVARLREGLKAVDHDYILLDVGPGTSSTLIELFNMADTGIVVTTTEPTSVENTYRFLKCVFIGKMKRIMNLPENSRLKELMQKAFDASWSERIKTFGDIFTALKALDADQAEYLRSAIEHTGVSILVNMARGAGDEGLVHLIKRGTRDYFNLEIGSLGFIRFEESVLDSVRTRKPLAVHYHSSGAAASMEKCLELLLEPRKRRQAL